MKKSLARRAIHYQSSEHWTDTLRLVAIHPAPSAERAARIIKKRIRNMKNPPLMHKGGKP